MEKIRIISRDKRFTYANELFIKNGYDCEICDPYPVKDADVVLFSPKNELSDWELDTVISGVKTDALVFTGNKERIKSLCHARIFDYSESESFLLDNAYVTAQCAIKLTFENTDFSLNGKKALVLGYGRIGKHLSSMLKSLCADVFIYARREESRLEALLNGFKICELKSLDIFDLIYNTVPYKIIKKELSDGIAKDSLVMELASSPGGFYDENVATKALGLPGKLMPRSAGKAIYDYVIATLSELRGEKSI